MLSRVILIRHARMLDCCQLLELACTRPRCASKCVEVDRGPDAEQAGAGQPGRGRRRTFPWEAGAVQSVVYRKRAVVPHRQEAKSRMRADACISSRACRRPPRPRKSRQNQDWDCSPWYLHSAASVDLSAMFVLHNAYCICTVVADVQTARRGLISSAGAVWSRD